MITFCFIGLNIISWNYEPLITLGQLSNLDKELTATCEVQSTTSSESDLQPIQSPFETKN